MIEILSHLHQYVPAREYTKEVYIPSIHETVLENNTELTQILFGGDQLTAARARSALKAMCNATTAAKRHISLLPVPKWRPTEFRPSPQSRNRWPNIFQ